MNPMDGAGSRIPHVLFLHLLLHPRLAQFRGIDMVLHVLRGHPQVRACRLPEFVVVDLSRAVLVVPARERRQSEQAGATGVGVRVRVSPHIKSILPDNIGCPDTPSTSHMAQLHVHPPRGVTVAPWSSGGSLGIKDLVVKKNSLFL